MASLWRFALSFVRIRSRFKPQPWMDKWFMQFSRLILTLALSISCAACNPRSKDHLTLTAFVLGRDYDIEIDGPGHLYPGGKATILKFGDHQLAIEKERLLVDGKESAKINPESQRFRITFKKSKLMIDVDGKNIIST